MKYYPFGKFVLSTPDDHKIRSIHQSDCFYDRLYGPQLEVTVRPNPRGTIIDIGANIGDTCAFFRTHVGNPILAVEGSGDLLVYLRENVPAIGPDITIIDKFIKPTRLVSNSMNYRLGPGSGRLLPADSGAGVPVADDRYVTIDALIAQAARNPDGIALFKTDTDGIDGFIMADVLGRVDCPLFFECDLINTFSNAATPWPDVLERLDAMNYAIIVFDNHGIPMLSAASGGGALLRDLSGYIHTQHCVGNVYIHYVDVWAYPPSAAALFAEAQAMMRAKLLKPYAF